MSDIYSKEKRSEIMAKISGKETKPEIVVRKVLFLHGFRYRKNVKNLPGKPDIVLAKFRTVIFVHGCFWHGHANCKAANLPVTNRDFWSIKISQNVARDKKTNRALKKAGWHVITVWQCRMGSKAKFDKTIVDILKKLDRYAENRQKLYQK